MQEFYKRALLALIALLVADALIAWFCIDRSVLRAGLLPQERGGLHWRSGVTTDAILGGTSTIQVHQNGQSLRFDFRMTRATQYPYVAAELHLTDAQGRPALADLTRYTSATFVATCAPANSLLFSTPIFDPGVSTPGRFHTYPSPAAFFSCSERGTPVSLDLTRMTVPTWWIEQMKVDPSRQSYPLSQVAKFVFGTSHHSPRELDARVEIADLALHGRDDRYIVALAVILVAGLGLFGAWFLRAHARALAASLATRLKEDMPFVAYRQLTLEPFRDKEKAAILQYIGSNFSNPELDIGSVVARIGVGREKINAVLKSELGMTFTAYVNKLRLTEAARLLAMKDGQPISDIAYAVGYASVSYFNKLFKEEYDCTPKAFRGLATQSRSAQAITESP
jgi:AraC-like DNA-binding protein